MTGSPVPSKKLPQLTVVIGGARSGKSRLAENLVSATHLPRHYIATAQAFDAEMHARIAQHLADRGPDWTTHECPLDLPPLLATIPTGHVILLDCATLWLTNHLLADADIAAVTTALLTALHSCAPIVVVTNELGWSIVPDSALARAFRDHQGRLNQALAAQADLVIAVIAGLPMVLKGTLP